MDMDKDSLVVNCAVLCAIALAVTLILGLVAVICRHNEEMARLGYQQTVVPGRSCTVWQRISDVRPEAGRPAN
jgi:hypothetical protein